MEHDEFEIGTTSRGREYYFESWQEGVWRKFLLPWENRDKRLSLCANVQPSVCLGYRQWVSSTHFVSLWSDYIHTWMTDSDEYRATWGRLGPAEYSPDAAIFGGCM